VGAVGISTLITRRLEDELLNHIGADALCCTEAKPNTNTAPRLDLEIVGASQHVRFALSSTLRASTHWKRHGGYLRDSWDT
jgi:hypothetical protein